MLNKVTLIGRVGKDPEIRYMQNGNPSVSLSLATSNHWTDKNSGQKKEKTEWHYIKFFNKTAENVGKYVKKGSLIYVEGMINTDKWQDDQGNDRELKYIIGNTVKFLSSPNNGSQSKQNKRDEGSGYNGSDDTPDYDNDDDVPF